VTTDAAAEGRRELARHRVSAEYALPLALVVGETEDEMRRAAHAALAEFNRSLR
jgi:hypothetical protein